MKIYKVGLRIMHQRSCPSIVFWPLQSKFFLLCTNMRNVSTRTKKCHFWLITPLCSSCSTSTKGSASILDSYPNSVLHHVVVSDIMSKSLNDFHLMFPHDSPNLGIEVPLFNIDGFCDPLTMYAQTFSFVTHFQQ